MGALRSIIPKNAGIVVSCSDVRKHLLQNLPLERLQQKTALNALAEGSGIKPEDLRRLLLWFTPDQPLLDGELIFTATPAASEGGSPSFILAFRPSGSPSRRALSLLQWSPIARRLIADSAHADTGLTLHNGLIHIANPRAAGFWNLSALHCMIVGDVVLMGNRLQQIYAARERLLSAPAHEQPKAPSFEIKVHATATDWRKNIAAHLMVRPFDTIIRPIVDAEGPWRLSLEFDSPARLILDTPLPGALPLTPINLAIDLAPNDVASWSIGLSPKAFAQRLQANEDEATRAEERVVRRLDLTAADFTLRPLLSEFLGQAEVQALTRDLSRHAIGGILVSLTPRVAIKGGAYRQEGELAMHIQVPLRAAATIPEALLGSNWPGTEWRRLNPTFLHGQVADVDQPGIAVRKRALHWTDSAATFPVTNTTVSTSARPAVVRGKIDLSRLATFLRTKGARGADMKDRNPSLAESRAMERSIRWDVERAAQGPLQRGQSVDLQRAINARLSDWRTARSKGSGGGNRMQQLASLIDVFQGQLHIEGQASEGRLTLTFTLQSE